MAMRCQPRLSDQNVGNTRSHGSLATIAGRMICRPVSLGRLFFCITALINELPGDSVALNRALSDAHGSRIRTLPVPSVERSVSLRLQQAVLRRGGGGLNEERGYAIALQSG